MLDLKFTLTYIIIKKLKQLEYYLREVEYKEWYYKEAIKDETEKNILANMPDLPTLERDKVPKKKK